MYDRDNKKRDNERRIKNRIGISLAFGTFAFPFLVYAGMSPALDAWDEIHEDCKQALSELNDVQKAALPRSFAGTYLFSTKDRRGVVINCSENDIPEI